MSPCSTTQARIITAWSRLHDIYIVLTYWITNGAEYWCSCIAISGLASHPFGSWKSRNDQSHFMWLRDGLPQDLPSIRTLLYGYDTQLGMSRSFQTIDDIAIAFAITLHRIGRSSPSARPLVLLAHSLGGIIVKKALVLLANAGDADQFILSTVKGVVMFGVPSMGMTISHLLPMVDGQPNKQLIEQLGPESDYLRLLDEQFTNIAASRNIRLISVYETQKTKTAQVSVALATG